MKIRQFVVASALMAAGACASSKQSARATAPAPVSDLDAPPPRIRFAGQFTPVMNVMSGSGMSSGAIRINGTVKVTSLPGSDDKFSMETEFTSERGAETLFWSIVDGRCGDASLPLVPPRQLTQIEVPSNGQVRMTSEFRATMVAAQAYHLNLYGNGGSDLGSVIGCANLKS